MRNNPLNDEKMREDQAWQREAQTLGRIGSQLFGQNMKIDQDDKTIKSWRSSRDENSTMYTSAPTSTHIRTHTDTQTQPAQAHRSFSSMVSFNRWITL